MSDNSILAPDLQGVISEDFAKDEAKLGPLVEAPEGKKQRSIRLSTLYALAGYESYAERAKSCGTLMTFAVMDSGRRVLLESNFCKLRLCPVCTGRKATKAARELTKVMDFVEKEHKNITFLFLTLTIKDVPGDELGSTITQLLKGWSKLTRHKRVSRAIMGWYRTIEITFNAVTKEFHPHIHAILVVENKYFKRKNGLYITQNEFRQRWQQVLGVSYLPQVSIQAVRAKPGRPVSGSSAAAVAVEAAKYCVKDAEYLGSEVDTLDAINIVSYYTKALFHRRFSAFGGWMLDGQQAIDNAPVEIRAELVIAIERWGWSFGEGSYMLQEYLSTKHGHDDLTLWRHDSDIAKNSRAMAVQSRLADYRLVTEADQYTYGGGSRG